MAQTKTDSDLLGPVPFTAMKADVGCSVYLSADQSIPTDTYTLIQFDAEDIDISDNWDTTNYKYVVGVGEAGYYDINLSIAIALSASTTSNAYIYINGGATYENKVTCASTEARVGNNINAKVYLNEGDEVEFKVYHTRGSNTILAGGSVRYTQANIWLIGKQ